MSTSNALMIREFLENDFTNDETFRRLYRECIYHEPSGAIRVGNQVWEFRAAFLRGFSDFQFEIHQIEEVGDTVWCRWTFSGKHTGEFAGIPPTGHHVRISMMTASRMKDGKVIEEWELSDTAALMEQLTSPPPSEARNKDAVRKLVQILNEHSVDRMGEFYASDIYTHGPVVMDIHGIEARKAQFRAVLHTTPDVQYHIDEMIAEGETVVLRYHGVGSHQGEWAGISPTGRSFNLSGTSVLRFRDGKIVDELLEWDALGLYRQFGVLPHTAWANPQVVHVP